MFSSVNKGKILNKEIIWKNVNAVSLYECVEHLFQADLKEEACLWILFKLLTPLCFLWYISAVFYILHLLMFLFALLQIPLPH